MSLVACECLPSPGLEPEPCSRARSQARVYLEQFCNRVALGVPDMTKGDYLVDAATQIRLALERDVSEDYEAAFNHYQNGVDVLLRGIHVDPNKERREAVKLKITKYLRRAEEIFNCHLQRPLSSGASPSAVQLVQDPATGGTFVVKSLPRCHMVSRERLTIIPHGVPYMTKLLRYFVSEDSIFLHLEHVQGHIRLTYFGEWSEVEPQCCGEAVDNLYSAPEVGGISELTEACDWWSFGSLLYELLTGMALSQSHPSGIQAHTQLQLPEWLSHPAASLLTELLQFEPTRRLGMGEGGVSKLKSHPFFSTIQWSKLVG
ncbi:ribosomal protein S6 kinase-like 1 isoform X14 [Gorilla gorilla gorilla]|uniref:ribosomal protein S6 kinase-like 1 isoform X14 n=1 Tax=Gorilla gorilla gorilla TaxID=9595 RepID=UPI002445A8D2|nr:ribosomal protein S6 kinase-like 1 isoform X14 [Gorilla gorilla gorilla]XP_055216945.1 ribosomal protein S6 kinase-like 1 isoform X14 [Gorilla gorilla gorilla]